MIIQIIQSVLTPAATPPGMSLLFKGKACLIVGFQASLQRSEEMPSQDPMNDPP